MTSTDSIQQFLEKYLLPHFQTSKQINKLSQILYVNPLLIYESEDQWKENHDKLQYLTAYNKAVNTVKYTFAYIGLVQLFGLANVGISKQYTLRQAWANNFCRKTFWIVGAAYLGYANFIVDKEKLFEKEIEKMQSLSNDMSYLHNEKYVKEKYFLKINNKLNSLCEDSYIVANSLKQERQKAEQDEVNSNISRNTKQDQTQNKKNVKTSSTKNNEGQNKNLRTDDYYFEISEIIQELDEESFFD